MIGGFERHVEHEMKMDRDAIERLKRRYPGWDFVETRQTEMVYEAKPSVLIQDIPQPPHFASEPLIGAVSRIIKSFPEKQWTSSMLYQALEADGFPLPPPKAQRMANISTGLGKLAGRPSPGVRLVHKGAGRNPNYYQWSESS